jgi:hypothetical protein
VDFFYGKKLHRPALELLQRFGQANEGDMAPTLRGPKRTVGYLQNLPPEMIDLILEFSEWPLRRDPEFGMEIFVTDSENAETLPRERVVSFLQGIDLKLAVKYLEHLIHELNDLTPDFHNRLVGLYLERLKRREDEKGAEYGDFQSDRERTEWREKLLSFLRASQQYSLARSLGLIPRDGRSRIAISNTRSLTGVQIQSFTRLELLCLAKWDNISKRWRSMFSNSKIMKKQRSK